MTLSIFPFPTPHAHGKPKGGSYIRERRPENADGNAAGCRHVRQRRSRDYRYGLANLELKRPIASNTVFDFAFNNQAVHGYGHHDARRAREAKV
jgi:hypothetical protein